MHSVTSSEQPGLIRTGWSRSFHGSSEATAYKLTYMPEDHTGMNLQDALIQTLSNWECDATKLVALTTDSKSDIVLTCELLNCRQLSCFGHNLDLPIQKGLADERLNESFVCAGKFYVAAKEERAC